MNIGTSSTNDQLRFLAPRAETAIPIADISKRLEARTDAYEFQESQKNPASVEPSMAELFSKLEEKSRDGNLSAHEVFTEIADRFRNDGLPSYSQHDGSQELQTNPATQASSFAELFEKLSEKSRDGSLSAAEVFEELANRRREDSLLISSLNLESQRDANGNTPKREITEALRLDSAVSPALNAHRMI